jgi:hypothetical protein
LLLHHTKILNGLLITLSRAWTTHSRSVRSSVL